MRKEPTSFDEIVEFGKTQGNVVNGIPWSFNFFGGRFTHENDDLYLVTIPGRGDFKFTRNDVIVVSEGGSLTIYSKEDFEKEVKKENEVSEAITDTNLDFSDALEYLKSGHKIARVGWNGKGMFAVLQKGYPQGIPCNKQTAEAFGMNEGELFKVRPYMQLKCADGTHAMWTPSGSDILANDWFVIK